MKKKELKKAIKELKSTIGLLYSKLDSSSLNTTDESELDEVFIPRVPTVEVKTDQVDILVTQITDENKQWAINVTSMVENALVNEISQKINKSILSRLFALGWTNNAQLYATEGIKMKKKELKKAIKELKSTIGLLYSKLDSSSLNTTDESELDEVFIPRVPTVEVKNNKEIIETDEVVTQIYKVQNSKKEEQLIYLNLFDIEIESIPNISEKSLSLFLEEITSCSLNLSSNYVNLNFEDNITNENKMLVYPILLKLKDDNITIPKMKISIYNRSGDVFLQYLLTNLIIGDMTDDIYLDYKARDILRPQATFNYKTCEILTLNIID